MTTLSKWDRPDLADHEYIEAKGGNVIACKCGEWTSTTPMPMTLTEWQAHQRYVTSPLRTNYGLLVMAWYAVLTLFFAAWTVHDFWVANRLANDRAWDQANFFLLCMAGTALTTAWSAQRFIRERDDA